MGSPSESGIWVGPRVGGFCSTASKGHLWVSFRNGRGDPHGSRST